MMHEGRTQVVTRSIYLYECDTMAWLRRPLHIRSPPQKSLGGQTV